MGDQQGKKSDFPIPPPFYQNFTDSNIKELRQLRKDQGIPHSTRETQNGDRKDLDILSLPPELRYLIPPPPPTDGKYRVFGTSLELNNARPETLEDAGIQILFPGTPAVKNNPRPYLISLARSMLTTFLALTGILSEDPTQASEKVDDLRTLLYNMHELINQYRPHQARETLILMMEERVEKMRNEVKAIGEAREKVEAVMRGIRETGEAQPGHNAGEKARPKAKDTATDDERKQRQRAAWAALKTIEAEEDGT